MPDPVQVIQEVDTILKSTSAADLKTKLLAASEAASASALNAKAPLASPAFTGSPTAFTQDPSDSSTKLATTAFVSFLKPAINHSRKKVTVTPGTFLGRPDLGGVLVLDDSETYYSNSVLNIYPDEDGVTIRMMDANNPADCATALRPENYPDGLELSNWTAVNGYTIDPLAGQNIVRFPGTTTIDDITPAFVGQIIRFGLSAPYQWFIAESISPVVWRELSFV